MSKGLTRFLKRNYKILLAALIIITGICIIMYPQIQARRFDRIHRQVLRNWNSFEPQNNSGEQNITGSSWPVSTVVIGELMNDSGIWDENTDPEFDSQYMLNQMVGILTIEKIDLRSAILAPATKNNLDISICSVLDTREMGQAGNYVLAGHLSRIYGRHFSRLKELSAGDIITVENKQNAFNYRVTEMYSVKPTEVWVMDNDETMKTITLITCDYAAYPVIDRWIVKGEIT